MRTELQNVLHNTVERVKYDPRLQGLVAASIFFLGGIFTYIPDHKMMNMQLPPQIDGRVFDAFGGGCIAGWMRTLFKDDIFASAAIGWGAPAGLEMLQKMGMIEGVYDSGDLVAPLFGIAAFLAAYYGIKLKNRVKQTTAEFLLGKDFPFKKLQDIKFIDPKFPLLKNPFNLQHQTRLSI